MRSRLGTEVGGPHRRSVRVAEVGPELERVSKRVGDYQSHPLWGLLFDQLWVE